MTRRISWWLIATMIGIPLTVCSSVSAQDEFEVWAPGDDNLWTNDDNWTFDGELSAAPSIDNERGAQVNGGSMIIDADVDTAGIRQNGGTIEIQSGSLTSEKTDLQTGVTTFNGNVIISGGAKLTGPDTKTTFGGSSSLQLLAANAEFEAKGDLSLGGALHFPITAGGNPVIQVSGEASLNGPIVPTFDGVTPGFGNSWKFADAGSVSVGDKSTVVLPDSVLLPKGLSARVESDSKTASLVIGNLPILTVDRVSGDANISNVVGGDITITGYSATSALGLLNGAGFTGTGTDGFVTPNATNQSLAEFSLQGSQTIAVGEVKGIGNAYNGGATHPNDEDVAFQFSTTSGDIIDGLVEYSGPANDIVLNANPEDGEVTLYHLSTHLDPVDITGYTLTSASGSLNLENWTSFVDSGAAGEGWSAPNPSGENLSELNLSSSKTFSNGTAISLGKIFGGAPDLRLQYATASDLFDATITYGVVPDGDVIGCTPANALLGDLDGNGTVAFADFLVLADNFGAETTNYADGDVDCNGTVAFADFLTLADNFGKSLGAQAAAVPEPNSGMLLGCGTCLLLTLRRRRRGNPMRKNFWLLLLVPVLMCGQVNGQVCDLDDCPIDELRVFTGEVANVRGPADVVSLRDPGNIIYAVNVWGEQLERVVNGVSFWSDREDVNPDGEGLEGYRTDWTHNVTNWQAKPEFGDSESDDELEEIMTDIRWTDNSPGAHPDPGVGSHFAVNPGDLYYLELLISGGHDENRIWDIYVDGEPVVSEFDSTNHLPYDPGEVYAYRGEFVAKDDELNVTFNQERRAGIDGNAILQAVMLSAPSSIILGDFNSDTQINLDDYGIMLANFHKAEGASHADGDINFDRAVDISDFLAFRIKFNEQRAGAASSVPEPNSLLLLSLTLVGISARRRSRRRMA